MNIRYETLKAVKSTVSFVAVATFLTGCASFDLKGEPTIVAPKAAVAAEAPAPQDWIIPAPDALPATDWVRAFPDPVLIELVDEALRKNTNIGAAYARLDAAIASERISRADRLPSVSANAGLSRTERVNEFIPDNTGLNAGFNASWEPDLWGRIESVKSKRKSGLCV